MHFAVIFSCATLLIVLLVAEVNRLNKAYFIQRLIANVIAIGSLVLLFIPINYSNLLTSSDAINIFTNGTNQDSVPKAFKRGHLIQSIPDLSYFLKGKPEVSKINVFGYGLAQSDLQNLKGYQFNFYPASISGIASISWNSKLSYTEELKVQGTYDNSSTNDIKLLLRGFGTDFDSLHIEAGKTQAFALSCVPKQAGKATLELIALSKEKIIQREKVPIEVFETNLLTVLMISSNPGFENKFLRNWLFEEGNLVMVRSRISKTATSSDFLNMKPINLTTISGQLLSKVDLLICDEQELAITNSQEYRQIEQAVANGMGLVITVSDSTQLKSLSLTRPINRYELPWSDKEQRLFLRPSNIGFATEKDKSDRILTQTTLFGKGKVTGSVLVNSYKWILEGNLNSYQRYWSNIISNTAKIKSNKTQYEIFPQIPTIGGPMRIVVNQDGSSVPIIKLNSQLLSPRQNVALPMEWDVKSFPISTGWNTLDINGEQHSLYVYPKEAWLSVKNANTSMENIKASSTSQPTKSNYVIKKENKRVPIWIFFVLFLLSAGFLWLEPKISYKNAL